MIDTLYQKFLESSGISTDTRTLKVNNLFFCLSGENFNGNKFASQALGNGAGLVVVDDEKYFSEKENMILVDDSLDCLQALAAHHRNHLNIPVIGITGTNGKTTTKELIAAVLSTHFNISFTQGNLNNHIGVPLSLLRITNEHEIAIIEMGANHLGEIAKLCQLSKPSLGIVTNIGHAHLEGFGSFENIKKTKLALFESVKKANGNLFVNADDEVLMNESLDVKRYTYGRYIGSQTQLKLSSDSVSLEFTWDSVNVKTKLFGHYNLYNAAAAISVGKYFKVPSEKIVIALEEYTPSNNRSQIEEGNNNELILDAYNANPDSMRGALQFFDNVDFSEKVVVLGDMLELGEFEVEEHEKILLLLLNCSFSKSILVGKAFLNFKTKYPQFVFFADSNEALEYLTENRIYKNKILLKGSRGIKLETLKDILL